MKHCDGQDFVHSDFPEPITKVKHIEVRYWEGEFALGLIRKYWPALYNKLTINIDFEV